MENETELPLLVLIVIIIFLAFRWIRQHFYDKEVEAHKNALLKGGLIKRRPQNVHKDAMSQLGREYPNKHLLKRQYYD